MVFSFGNYEHSNDPPRNNDCQGKLNEPDGSLSEYRLSESSAQGNEELTNAIGSSGTVVPHSTHSTDSSSERSVSFTVPLNSSSAGLFSYQSANPNPEAPASLEQLRKVLFKTNNSATATFAELKQVRDKAYCAVKDVWSESSAAHKDLKQDVAKTNTELENQLNASFSAISQRIDGIAAAATNSAPHMVPTVASLAPDQVNRVPTFSGSYDGTQQFSIWLRKLQDAMNMRTTPLSNQQKAYFLVGHLDGVAREKVDELPDNERTDFDAVVQHLRAFFESPQQRYIARQNLSTCKQLANENCAEFANRVWSLVRAATAGQAAAVQKERALEEFVARLRGDIRYYVKLENPTSLEQAVTKARTIEQLLAEAASERLINPASSSDQALVTLMTNAFQAGQQSKERRDYRPRKFQKPRFQEKRNFRQGPAQNSRQNGPTGHYEHQESTLSPETGPLSRCVEPPELPGKVRPVLYQVVSKHVGQGVVLECKDFLVIAGRLDLHVIMWDQYSANILSNTRGFRLRDVAVKDFVWVFNVQPTQRALAEPLETLKNAALPRAAGIVQKEDTFLWRAAAVAPVEVQDEYEPRLGIVLGFRRFVDGRVNKITHLELALEGSPQPYVLPKSFFSGDANRLEQYQLVQVQVRKPSSTAVRFSEPYAGKESFEQLHKQFKFFLPCHPEEGVSPVAVFPISDEWEEFRKDRFGQFTKFEEEQLAEFKRTTRLFSVCASALAAHSSLEEDRSRHNIIGLCKKVNVYPIFIQFTINKMKTDGGWRKGRKAQVLFPGTTVLSTADIADVMYDPVKEELAVQLAFWRGSEFGVKGVLQGKTSKASADGRTIPMVVRLERPSTSADPTYELISQQQVFDGVKEGLLSEKVIQALYGATEPDGSRSTPRYIVPRSAIVNGNRLRFKNDQREALTLALRGHPVTVIRAGFGTGKTLVGATLASLVAQQEGLVVATAVTNAAGLQFADTLGSLDSAKDLSLLRFVSEEGVAAQAGSNRIDLQEALKRLSSEFRSSLSQDELKLCEKFQKGREIIEDATATGLDGLTEEQCESFKIADREASDILKQMVNLLFKLRPPKVLVITVASFLNTTGEDGLFSKLISEPRLVIADEGSQIPEPAIIALASRANCARHVYIGDDRQLEPHCKISRRSTPAEGAARSALEVLLRQSAVHRCSLVTTFRAHPGLNELANAVTYSGELISGTAAADRTKVMNAVSLPDAEFPVALVNVQGESTRNSSHSYQNEAELEACEGLVSGLSEHGFSGSIAVICFYKDQYIAARNRFHDSKAIDVATVDSVQGREYDAVILLTTRTGLESIESAGFIDDPKRVNVALTRAKHGMFILGHITSLATQHGFSSTEDGLRVMREV